MTEDVDYRLRNAENRLHTLDRRIDDLESEHSSLETKFGFTEDLDSELRRIRDAVSECEDRAEQLEEKASSLEDDLTGRVNDAARAVKRLTQHVRLLEGQVIAAGAAPAADLDAFTADQRALAGTMLRGWKAAESLLPQYESSTHRRRVQRSRQTAAEHLKARDAVVNLTGVLAAQRWGGKEHADAAERLPAAITREATLRRRAAEQEDEARESTGALDADAEVRASSRPDIDAGVRAEKRLTLTLRSRLSRTVSDRMLLPVWFVTVLGAAPPARQTDEWLECATRVLLYRLAYDVDDQVLALGPAPDPDETSRHSWYEELCKDPRNW